MSLHYNTDNSYLFVDGKEFLKFKADNSAEFKYYPFMISLDKYSGSCNSVDDLSTKICVLTETKDIYVKVFNMIITRNEAKAILKHILCDC